MNGDERWGEPDTADLDVAPAKPEPATLVPAEQSTPVVTAPARKPGPIDHDKVRETAWAVVGAALFLAGVLTGLVALATRQYDLAAGAAVLIVGGGVPAFYTLRKASQRIAEREARAGNARGRETTRGITG